MRCLTCNGLIPPKFKDVIKWESKAEKSELEYDYALVRKTARMQCPTCKSLHDYTKDNITEMNRLDEYVSVNPSSDGRVRSFDFNKLSLPPPISH